MGTDWSNPPGSPPLKTLKKTHRIVSVRLYSPKGIGPLIFCSMFLPADNPPELTAWSKSFLGKSKLHNLNINI